MKMRLDKMLGNMGIGTRKEVKLLVRWGRVLVNGERAWTGADYVDPDNDKVEVDGEAINFKALVYLMLNKPTGYVSATVDSREATIIELVPEEFQHYELFPVGRLDKDTVGLILLTNDGKLTHDLISPKNHIEKKYFVKLSKSVEDNYDAKFKKGVTLDDGYETMPARFEKTGENEGYVTIMEGKFHQVKRMFETLGNEVVFLKRISIGSLVLDESLELGEIRELTDMELEALKR